MLVPHYHRFAASGKTLLRMGWLRHQEQPSRGLPVVHLPRSYQSVLGRAAAKGLRQPEMEGELYDLLVGIR
jgi:hypothetical protein